MTSIGTGSVLGTALAQTGADLTSFYVFTFLITTVLFATLYGFRYYSQK